MTKLTAIKNLIKNPRKLFRVLGDKKVFNWMPDKTYLKILYQIETGKSLNLESPKSYNEKLQWLKLYNRRQEYTTYVDKYEVRDYIKGNIGESYLIPLLGVYESVEEIDWEDLPEQFVLKCTHGSGSNIICKDKSKLDIKLVNSALKKWMKKNWYWFGREWPYKNVRPRIIVEKYLDQIDDDELRDYRFFCFNGEPKFIAVDYSITDKSKTRRNLYDLNWNMIPAKISYPNELEENLEKPDNLAEMISLSKKLSKDIPHVRVDFYNIDGKILFGEMTFYHQSGFGKIYPTEFNYKMGDWIKI